MTNDIVDVRNSEMWEHNRAYGTPAEHKYGDRP